MVLTVENLVKRYCSPDGELHTVIDVPSLAMQAGEHIALRGESGSGKTTLLNLIAGILTPDQGEVRVAGSCMTGLSEAKRDQLRAKSIGYIFQTFNLLHGYTAIENVELAMRFGPGLDRERANALLDRMGLKDRKNYRPGQLSVGQQQRVAVARALANRPSLVLADEPTGNLDVRRAAEAMDLIREACRENSAALLLVSHDQRMLDQFEKVYDLAEINRAARLDDEPELNQIEGGAA